MKQWIIIKSEPPVYLDIFHCDEIKKFRTVPNFIYWEPTIDLFVVIKEGNLTRTKDPYCPICNEKMPDYIKFQVHLLE